MTKTRDVHLLLQQCIAKMRAAGYNAARVKEHQKWWAKGIRSYMERKGLVEYEPSIGESYLQEECSHLSQNTLKGRRRNVNILNEFLLYGTISSRIQDFCKYPILNNPLGQIATDFFRTCELRGLRPLTIVHHKRVLSLFLKSLKIKGIETIAQLSSVDIIKFVAEGKQPRQRLYSLRSFLKYIVDNNDSNVVSLLNSLYDVKFRQRDRLPSYYEDNEIQRLKDAVDRFSPVGKRDYAVILLAADFALRASDIANLTKENISRNEKTLNIAQAKTGEILCMPISDEAMEAIDDYIDNVRPNVKFPQIFVTASYPLRPLTCVTINCIVRRAFRDAKITIGKRHFGTHSLRHSLATTMLSKGVSLPTISSILGHTSTATTMSYLRLDVEGLRNYALEVPLVKKDFFEQQEGIFYE